MNYTKIIIGAGLYGLYAAKHCGEKKEKILVLEKDDRAFGRATYVNQARVHMGYHYPRSLSTATKSAGYFRRFCDDFPFCIEKGFHQIYATSSRFSWTNAEQFQSFCKAAGIRCEEAPVSLYFKEGMCDGAFLTEEYTYDAMILKKYFLDALSAMPNVTICYNAKIEDIARYPDHFEVHMAGGSVHTSDYILNATYASTNEVLKLVDGVSHTGFNIKYELCEIILTKASEKLRGVGLTVMDGPFFSIMPFGKTGYHSLTSVSFTPHMASYERLPAFPCMERRQALEGEESCRPEQLANCTDCPCRPESAWPYMSHLARKYMREEYEFTYQGSLYSMKPILKSSEVDDSRPTAIRVNSEYPRLVSVLSGKINTVYDLEEFL